MTATPILELKNVTKMFDGVKAIDDVHFSIQKGEIVGLIGPNGAGKTTIFNIIGGVFPPTSGEIFYKGQKINGLKPHHIAHKGIARTFQIVQPFRELTALDNVLIGALSKEKVLKKARQKAADVLDFLGMGNKKDVLAGNLTLPEQKRLEVAKALASDPELLLLDEVMAGLTPTEVDTVVDMIKQVHASGVTVLLIEHVMHAVMSLCEKVIVLNYGEMITIGTPDEVVADSRVIDAYLGEELDFVKSE